MFITCYSHRLLFRIQFKTLKLVFVISYFYKVFVQFSSHSIELILKQVLNYSADRRKSRLYFFPGAFNIKLFNSFQCLLSSFDTQIMNCLARHKIPSLFEKRAVSTIILISTELKIMLQCFVLVCNRSRASSTRTRPTSTHIGRRGKIFLKLLNLGLNHFN